LCIIARNEEDNLRECLKSVTTLVDEIVIVDTGSTDGTKLVAASFGARIVDFVWRDDFSAARNECMRHAAGDWLFWLDADERLDVANQSRMRFLLGELQAENVAYAMLQLSRLSNATSLPLSKTTVRLFRNDPKLHWRNRVHEQILPALREYGAELRRVDVTIDHLGFQDTNALRSKRDRNLYLLQLDEAEHPNDVGILFNLGVAFLDNAQPDKALPNLLRSLKLAHPRDSIVRKLHVLISQAQGRLGQRANALATLRTARKRFPNDAELLSTEVLSLAEAGHSPPRNPR
jgi:glycosyltransferase involved in cell wall biosynthesis